MPGSVKEAHLGFKERFLRGFAWCVIHLVHRPKVAGAKPKLDRPSIFVCRHVGLMDPVILMVLYYRQMIRPLVAKDYYDKSDFTRRFYTTAQCIPIDRRNVSKDWIEASLAALAKGESIIIFPEGRRNKDGSGLLPFHKGAALLAARSGAQIIPVYNAVWNFPHRYRLAIGAPYDLPTLPPEGESSAWLQQQTGRIQDSVAALAPLVGD